MEKASVRPKPGKDARNRAVHIQVEGQIEEEHADHSDSAQRCPSLPPSFARSSEAGLQEHRPDEEDQVDGHVPGVDCAQRPHTDKHHGEGNQVPPQPAEAERLVRRHHVEAHPNAEQDNRQRHEVGMQVAQDESEDGELGNGVVQEGLAHDYLRHPCGTPPPPEVGGIPVLAVVRGRHSLNANPRPEPLTAHTVRVEHLQHALQIAQNEKETRRHQAENDCRPVTSAAQLDQVVHHTERPNGREAVDQGH